MYDALALGAMHDEGTAYRDKQQLLTGNCPRNGNTTNVMGSGTRLYDVPFVKVLEQ